MSNFSEDDIRHAAEVREWLMKQISDKQEQIDKMSTILTLIDSLLKQSSFNLLRVLPHHHHLLLHLQLVSHHKCLKNPLLMLRGCQAIQEIKATELRGLTLHLL